VTKWSHNLHFRWTILTTLRIKGRGKILSECLSVGCNQTRAAESW